MQVMRHKSTSGETMRPQLQSVPNLDGFFVDLTKNLQVTGYSEGTTPL